MPNDRVEEFLARTAQATRHGSLVLAIDATGSREDSWDLASHLQA